MRALNDLTDIQQRVTSCYSLVNCSINLNTGLEQPRNGYMVSVQNLYEGALMNFPHPFEIAQQIESEHQLPLSNRLYIGGWIDNSSGVWYCDLSVWVSDLNVALEIASNNNELAIWDCLNNEEMRVN